LKFELKIIGEFDDNIKPKIEKIIGNLKEFLIWYQIDFNIKEIRKK